MAPFTLLHWITIRTWGFPDPDRVLHPSPGASAEVAAPMWCWFAWLLILQGASLGLMLSYISRDPKRDRGKVQRSPAPHHLCCICWAKKLAKISQTQKGEAWTPSPNGKGVCGIAKGALPPTTTNSAPTPSCPRATPLPLPEAAVPLGRSPITLQINPRASSLLPLKVGVYIPQKGFQDFISSS